MKYKFYCNEKFVINLKHLGEVSLKLKDTSFINDSFRYLTFLYFIKNSGILVHSSCLKNNKNSIIFPAEPHSGKSTIVNLLDGISNFKMLHDDLTCVYFEGNNKIPFVQPFPFLTPDKISPYCNKKFPLKAIFFLNGKGRNRIKKISKMEALKRLIANANIYNVDQRIAQSILDTSSRIVEIVPCYTLSFKKDPSIANLILKTLDEI